MLYLNIQNSRYISPPCRKSLAARIFPSLSFYCHFLRIVFSAARNAKRGNYGYDVWGVDSLHVLRNLERIGIQFEITGLEYLENLQGPCIFVGNHMSIMETLILPSIILPYAKTTYVVKESLLTYPVFKYVMCSRNPIAVTRTNPRQDFKTVMTEGRQRLKDGISIIVFPQTTRSLTLDPEHFGSIGTKLAKHANVPIIPVALKTDAWSNGSWSKDFGKLYPDKPVRLAFGSPVTVQGKGIEEHEQIVGFIADKIALWRESC